MSKHVKMKIFALIALFLFCNVINGVAQENNNIAINVKNASLKEVFNAIEKQTTYRFYRNIIIDSVKNIAISKTNATVTSVLDEVLAGQNLTYNIVSSKSIVISDKQVSVKRIKR